jgi:hypothetical protein
MARHVGLPEQRLQGRAYREARPIVAGMLAGAIFVAVWNVAPFVVALFDLVGVP